MRKKQAAREYEVKRCAIQYRMSDKFKKNTG